MAIAVTNGLDLKSQRIQNLGTPSVDADAANKSYVDSVARGLDWKASARAASTGNIDLTTGGLLTIDGVALATGDRVLAKDQTAGAQNGIYAAGAGAWARAVDADSDAEVTSGMAVSVTEGTANGDKTFVLTTNDPITVGTTALAFSQLGGGAGYVAGDGLTESPAGTFNVGAGTGISVSANAVAVDTSVVMRRFAANIGDGAATVYTITHGFGTYDVQTTVYLNSGARADEIADVDRPSVNEVRISFATAPASGAYRAVVLG